MSQKKLKKLQNINILIKIKIEKIVEQHDFIKIFFFLIFDNFKLSSRRRFRESLSKIIDFFLNVFVLLN